MAQIDKRFVSSLDSWKWCVDLAILGSMFFRSQKPKQNKENLVATTTSAWLTYSLNWSSRDFTVLFYLAIPLLIINKSHDLEDCVSADARMVYPIEILSILLIFNAINTVPNILFLIYM